MLTKERASALGEFLSQNEECADKFENLTPEEIAQEINAHGFDFTASEIMEFVTAVNANQETGELSEDALENVAGGGLWTTFWTNFRRGQRDHWRQIGC